MQNSRVMSRMLGAFDRNYEESAVADWWVHTGALMCTSMDQKSLRIVLWKTTIGLTLLKPSQFCHQNQAKLCAWVNTLSIWRVDALCTSPLGSLSRCEAFFPQIFSHFSCVQKFQICWVLPTRFQSWTVTFIDLASTTCISGSHYFQLFQHSYQAPIQSMKFQTICTIQSNIFTPHFIHVHSLITWI